MDERGGGGGGGREVGGARTHVPPLGSTSDYSSRASFHIFHSLGCVISYKE